MRKTFVIDTCALISYFDDIFKEGSTISGKALKIIDNGFKTGNVKLIFPTVVFIEIYHKFCTTEELNEKIKYEIFYNISQKENMEIQPIDREILSNFIQITDIEADFKFDNHDKQVYASAMAMKCPLITSDGRLFRYNNRKKYVPEIIQ